VEVAVLAGVAAFNGAAAGVDKHLKVYVSIFPATRHTRTKEESKMAVTTNRSSVILALLLIATLLVGGVSTVSARAPSSYFPVPPVVSGASRLGPTNPLVQKLDPAKVAAAIQANAQALKAFVWQQRLQLQLKGETKKTTLNQMNYDVNGNQQKTLLSEQPSADSAPPPQTGGRLRGRVKQKVVAKKTGEFKEMMEGIAQLVKSYTELQPQQLQAALKQAAFSPGQGNMAGSVQIQMSNLIQQGDTLTIWIDEGTLLFRQIAIVSSYDHKPLTATANYATLPSGHVYMGQALVNYPAKEVVVQIDNLNYQSAQ
jgi:hypothetical protein